MTRDITTSPLTDLEAHQQLEAIKYLNTGFNLYCEVLRRQGFETDKDKSFLVSSLANAIVLGEHTNHIGQNLKSGRNDKLRFNIQAGSVEGVTINTILEKAKAKEVESTW